MKKILGIMLASFFLFFVFTSCEKHEHQWEEATCTSPEKCITCEEVRGDAMGHDLSNVTCTTGGKCVRCGQSLDALGHDYSPATCTDAKKCRLCYQTVGEALGHTTSNGACGRCGLEIYETVTGFGDDVVTNITTGSGVYRIHFTHTGRSNFIIWMYDSSNNKDLLVNEVGRYDSYVLLDGVSPYSFEISADGAWSYTIEKITTTDRESFSGRGDFVTPIISSSEQIWEFSHDGSSNFIVWVHTAKGSDLLVNEIGRYDGRKVIDMLSTGGSMIFEVKADGNWTLGPAV